MKLAKRLVREKVNTDGSLSLDKFCRTLLSHKYAPDPDKGVSPAQVLFSGKVKDFMPTVLSKFKPQEGWRLAKEDREKALRIRFCKGMEKWSEHTKEPPKLVVGESVLIQNQKSSPKQAGRWDRSGVVLEVWEFDKYAVPKEVRGMETMSQSEVPVHY